MSVTALHGAPARPPNSFRVDALADFMDQRRSEWSIEPFGAAWIKSVNGDRISGRQIAIKYSVLLHYTRSEYRTAIERGGLREGCFFTPTPYSGCASACAIGLPSPVDTVVAIDPTLMPEWCGPAVAVPSRLAVAEDIWPGGAIEFLCLDKVPIESILHVADVRSCGDAPWDWVRKLRSP